MVVGLVGSPGGLNPGKKAAREVFRPWTWRGSREAWWRLAVRKVPVSAQGTWERVREKIYDLLRLA